MSGALRIGIASEPVESADADVAVVACVEDDRPLRGAASRADWRLCGRLSELLAEGRLMGQLGEAALLPSTGGIRAPKLLALGAGPRHGIDGERVRGWGRDALTRSLLLRAVRPVIALLPSELLAPRDQVEELVAGIVEGWQAAGDDPGTMEIRLLATNADLSEASAAISALAGRAWPPGVELRAR